MVKQEVAVDQQKECDFESYVLDSILDVFYDDVDISIAHLFEIDNVFFSKINAINSNFTYLCDVFPNGYSVCDNHFMHIFNINPVQTELFNLGMDENLKNILVASDLTLEEREKIKEILRKRQKVFTWSYDDMPGVDREIIEYYIPTYSHIMPIKQK